MPAPTSPESLDSQRRTPAVAGAPAPPGPPALPRLPGLPGPQRVRFTDLAGEAVEVEVEHAGQIYRLRRTKAGKLLLTK